MSACVKVDFLREHAFFAELSQEQLAEIAALAATRRIQRGEILGLEGEPCTTVYFVLQGRIRAVKVSSEGREQVVDALSAGQGFYIVPALDGLPLPLMTQADTRTILLSFPRNDFVAILQRYPSVLMHVTRAFAQRLRRLVVLVEDLALRSVSQRLARLLVERARAPTVQRMTQQEMAAHLGTVREVVARALGSFDRRGWIKLQRGRIEILDLQALVEEAQ